MAKFDTNLHIVSYVVDLLEAAGEREASKALCKISKPLREHVVHQVHRTIDLIGENELLTFKKFADLKLINPSRISKIRFLLSPDQSLILSEVMKMFFGSPYLQHLELQECAGGPAIQSELHSLALRLASSTEQPLTIVLVNVNSASWRYCQVAQHLYLSNCSLVLDYPPSSEANSMVFPLQTLSFSTDLGMESFETLDILEARLPNLKRLFLYFKPPKEEWEFVNQSITTILTTAENLEDIIVTYEGEYPLTP